VTLRNQTVSLDRFLPILPLGLISGALVFLTNQEKEILGLVAILAVLGTFVICIRPAIGIALFLTSFFVTYGDALAGAGRFTPNNVLGLFFAVLLIVKIYHEKGIAFLSDRIIQSFIALVLFFHLSSHILERQLGNPYPQLDLTARMLHDLTTRFAFLVFFVNFIRTIRDIKLVLWVLIGVIFLSGVSGVMNAIFGEGFGIGGYRAAADWGISAAGNANRLAFYCVLGIAIIWYYKRAVHSRAVGLVLSAAIPGLAVAALMTASRSGLLNLVAVFALVSMEGRFSLKRQLNVMLSVALVVFVAGDLLSETHLERLGNIPFISSSGSKGGSSTEKRINTLVHGAKIIADKPVAGTGIGNFRWTRLQKFGSVGPPHNSYLWAATEGGITALALYLLIFWLAFHRALEVERFSTNPELRLIASGIRTGLMSFLFFSLFADFWLNIMAYVLVGLAVALKNASDAESRVEYIPGANKPAVPV